MTFVDTDTDHDTGGVTGFFTVGPWSVEVDLAPTTEGSVVTALRVAPQSAVPPGGLTTRLIRDLGLEHLQSITRENAALAAETLASGRTGLNVSPALQDDLRREADQFRRRPRLGPRAKPLEEYARVAKLYANANPRRRNAEVADELCLSVSTVTNMVREARRLEILSKTTRGKSGGDLTALGEALYAAWERGAGNG